MDNRISNQEEADTKVVLHALGALNSDGNNVCICSSSGDTGHIGDYYCFDPLVLVFLLTQEIERRSGSSNRR